MTHPERAPHQADPSRPQPDRPLAMVTGASSGIGAAVARKLAQRGYRLILLAHRAETLDAIVHELSHSTPSLPVLLDLTNRHAIEPAIGEVLAELGPVDVLVNNAGAGFYRPFLEHHPDDHLRLMQLHYHAPAMLIRLVLPAMLERGRGHVINIASMAAKMGPWGHAAYGASKAALVSLTQTLAAEYAQADIHFSVVNPGIVDTAYFRQAHTVGLWPRVQRWAIDPARVAQTVVRLLDRPRLEVCVPKAFRTLDLVKAVNIRMAHRLTTLGSRPDGQPIPAQPDDASEAAPGSVAR